MWTGLGTLGDAMEGRPGGIECDSMSCFLINNKNGEKSSSKGSLFPLYIVLVSL